MLSLAVTRRPPPKPRDRLNVDLNVNDKKESFSKMSSIAHARAEGNVSLLTDRICPNLA